MSCVAAWNSKDRLIAIIDFNPHIIERNDFRHTTMPEWGNDFYLDFCMTPPSSWCGYTIIPWTAFREKYKITIESVLKRAKDVL